MLTGRPIYAALRSGSTALFEEMSLVAVVASRGQHCVQFDQPEISTSEILLYCRDEQRVTARPIRMKIIVDGKSSFYFHLCICLLRHKSIHLYRRHIQRLRRRHK